MIRQLEINATVTGFEDGNVSLKGVFEWEFDPQHERLLTYEARDFSLSRDEYVDPKGVIFTFFYELKDLTTRNAHETSVGDSRGLRDTVHFVVRLMSKHKEGGGMANTRLGTETLREAGNRYYEPPLEG